MMNRPEICKLCRRDCFLEESILRLKEPKLNVGSGEMLLSEWINYDLRVWKKRGLETDIIGTVADLTSLLPHNYFAQILSAHMIEHLQIPEAIRMLKDFYILLRPGGMAIIEGPDVLGAYWYYIEVKNSVQGLVNCLYAGHNVTRYGPEMQHVSGWTGCSVAQHMAEIGYYIKHVGVGQTHGMGRRDFRAVGVKRTEK